jgi:transcriptional antiterminator NusG
MPYFAIYCRTRSEKEYITQAKTALNNYDLNIIWLRRSLRIRRRGKQIETLAPIFPGYLFVEAQEISPEIFITLSRIPGFLRFLNSNENIVPLSRDDRDLLIYLLSFGQIVRKSVVYFDKNNRIRVVSGPLKQLEGQIIKVDRRKGRAKVRLDMFKNSFLIDFGFDTLEKI